MRKFVATKQGNAQWVDDTFAGTAAKELRLEQLATLCATQNKSNEENALKMLILAALEDYYRCRKSHKIIQPFINSNHKKLTLSLEYIQQWLPSILDVAQIDAQLPDIWNTIEHIVNINSQTISNATFDLSYILRADCQMILDNAIIDIRTTAKRQPFTLNNFYQQLSYLLYDTDDKYQISSLAWVYSRQKVAFSYGVRELFKDISSTRADFKTMIVNHYRTNEVSMHNRLVQQSTRYLL